MKFRYLAATPHASLLRLWAAVVLLLLLTSCGGEAAEVDGGGPESTDSDATQTAVSEPEQPATTDKSGSAYLDTNSAMVVLAGETYRFARVEGGTCDPDFFGVYRAFLARVDDRGQPIENKNAPGFPEGITISLSLTDQNDYAAGGEFGGTVWVAGRGGNLESDTGSYSVNGASAHGTLSFVNSDGEVVEATFEVLCSEG